MRSVALNVEPQVCVGIPCTPSAAVADALADELECDGVEVLGLWQIANRCVDLASSRDDPHGRTLRVVADLMTRQIEPGDYDAAGFHAWPSSIEERVARIDAAWAALGRMPDIVDPICWFAKRGS